MDTNKRISELADSLILRMINTIYDEDGFHAALDEIERRLEYGKVSRINGLYRITTGGWSDDEALLHSLCSILSKLRKHYCGYIKGGAYYFCEEKHANVEMVRVIEYE